MDPCHLDMLIYLQVKMYLANRLLVEICFCKISWLGSPISSFIWKRFKKKKRILYLGHFKVTQISHSVFTCVHSYWRYFNSPCLSTFYVIYFLYFWQPVSYFLSALTNANYFISLPDVLLISSISPSFRIDERYMIFF